MGGEGDRRREVDTNGAARTGGGLARAESMEVLAVEGTVDVFAAEEVSKFGRTGAELLGCREGAIEDEDDD